MDKTFIIISIIVFIVIIIIYIIIHFVVKIWLNPTPSGKYFPALPTAVVFDRKRWNKRYRFPC